MCSKNEIEFSIDKVTGALSVNTTDLQVAIGKELESLLGMSLGLPTKDELIKEELHSHSPAKVRINASR
jgi:hypothetical protein